MSIVLGVGATGVTGKHFLPIALGQGHDVRVLARNPTKLVLQDAKLRVQQGSITDAALDFDKLVKGADWLSAGWRNMSSTAER